MNHQAKLKSLKEAVMLHLNNKYGNLKGCHIEFTNGDKNFPNEYGFYIVWDDYDGKKPSEEYLGSKGLKFAFPSDPWEKFHTDSYPSGSVNYYRKQIVNPL